MSFSGGGGDCLMDMPLHDLFNEETDSDSINQKYEDVHYSIEDEEDDEGLEVIENKNMDSNDSLYQEESELEKVEGYESVSPTTVPTSINTKQMGKSITAKWKRDGFDVPMVTEKQEREIMEHFDNENEKK